MADPIRKIVREPRFDAELLQIEADLKRADELLSGVTWILQRDPERYGTRLSQWDDVWFIPAADVFPRSYGIYYTFNDTYVYLLSIRESEEP